jgi:rhodanese-related sulfurtransferase/polyisoprenoid-binding protein YceI
MIRAHAFKQVTPDDLRSRMNEGRKILLIDTLPAEHFQKIHLPGASNACVYEIVFLNRVNALSQERSTAIVLYGASSSSFDARTAAEKLSMAGYTDVTILDGGIDRWRQSGFPLEGDYPLIADDLDSALLLEDGDYIILPYESRIGWTGRNANSRHFGTVNISGGNLHIADSAIQGSVTVDMESIENINLAGHELQPVLLSHLKSDDFFFVDAFPAARLEIRGGRFKHEPHPTLPNCELAGTLDLRGVQNDLTFEATVVKWSDGYLHMTAHFDLDRTLWGIIYGSSRYYEHLGMHTVFDHISIELQVVADRKP